MDTDSTLMYYLPFESRMARMSMQDVTHLFPVEDLPYVYRIRSIQTIVPWILLTFGLIGNVFVLCVFLRKKPGASTSRFQISSNGFCFCALAIADSFALIFMMMRSLMLVELIKNLTISCKLLKFTYYVSLQISSWCMVLLTIDRLIAVTFVFKYQVWAKNFLARKVLIGIVLGIILLNSHILIFVTSEISEDDLITTTTRKTPNLLKLTTTKTKFLPNYICTASKHPFYNKYFYSHWDTYHAIIYGALPFIIILISTGLIILRLYRYRNHRMFKATSQSSATDDSDRFRPVQITVMLLSVASLFLLFTGPISIYMTFFYYNLTWMRESKQSFIRTILTHFAYCNNVVNFYVYLALSSEFRREWLKVVSGVFYCCKSLNPKNVTSVCTTTTTTLGSNENLNRAPITRTPKLNTQTESQTQSTSPLLKTESTSSNVPPVPKPRRLKPVKLSIDSEKPLLERNKTTAPKRDPYNNQADGFINSNSTFV